jgi:hypothetical protein
MMHRKPFGEFLEGSFVGVMLRKNPETPFDSISSKVVLDLVDDALPLEEYGSDYGYFGTSEASVYNIWLTDEKWLVLLKEKYHQCVDQSSRHAMALVYVDNISRYQCDIDKESFLAALYNEIEKRSIYAEDKLEFNI